MIGHKILSSTFILGIFQFKFKLTKQDKKEVINCLIITLIKSRLLMFFFSQKELACKYEINFLSINVLLDEELHFPTLGVKIANLPRLYYNLDSIFFK